MGTYALIENELVVNVVLWDGVEFDEETGTGWSPPDGCIAVEIQDGSDVSIGWTYADGQFSPPPEPVVPPPTDEEISAANIAQLQLNQRISDAQKTALSSRISVLADAVDLGMATPEEIAELTQRRDQLIEWKTYAVYLGRVTQQEGWALTVVWPEQPEIAIP